jgi:DNA-binding NarL/FixJ family response regulator
LITTPHGLLSAPRPRLLLVEDEPEAREALARALGRAGYDVDGFADAASAREHLAELATTGARLPAIAVLDVVLGRDQNGGLDVLAALRALSPTLPVVIVTAFADVARVKRALNLGASHLLEKPFRASELVPVLEQLAGASTDPGERVTRMFTAASLTTREAEIGRLALKGLSSPEIADVLTISEKTVRQHLSRVYDKLGVSSRGELVHLLFPV